MAIPAPGTAISVNTIVGEFGGTAPHSLSEYYRGGGLVPNTPGNANIPTSGAIPMAGFYGSANRTAIALSIASNTYNYDVYTNRSPAYVAGSSDITVTVNPGVTVGSTSTGTYALLVPSSFNPADTVTIVNSGVIQGMGGNAGNGGTAGAGSASPGSSGSSGGNAIYVNRPTTITNNGTIAGGGGGGGGGGGAWFGPIPKNNFAGGGGGGGGGSGTNAGSAGSGGTGSPSGTPRPGSAGSAGTSPTGGGGGAGGYLDAGAYGGTGGTGGGRGAAGSTGNTGTSPGPKGSGGSGGAAGNYVVGNSFVTWPATGTRQGGVA